MYCRRPIRIQTKESQRTVGCGKCELCLQKKRIEWTYRLICELKAAKYAHFITLTYDDDNLTWAETEATLAKRDIQLFMKKLRKHNRRKLRYFFIGEYGEKGNRPHYHAIIFNIDKKMLPQISKIWGMGDIKIGSVTQGSIHYCTKYMINKYHDYPNKEKPFAMMSRNSGIGLSYIEEFGDWHKEKGDLFVYHKGGYKHIMPRYLREKIWDRDELKKLMLKVSNDIMGIQIENGYNPELSIEETAELISKNHDPLRDYNRKKVNINRISKSAKCKKL